LLTDEQSNGQTLFVTNEWMYEGTDRKHDAASCQSSLMEASD